MTHKAQMKPFLHQNKPQMFSRPFFYQIWQRIIEMTFSILLLLLLSPIFLIVSLAIILTSEGPVFFLQERVGINGKPFTIWKFRTMTINALPPSLQTEEWKDGIPDQFIYKSSPGISVTNIGKILRKYSIDELPQLINIVKGDMSFVGPRPETPNIASFYNDYQKQRLLVKPGITGYAQINGRSHLTHGMKIEYDLYYIQSKSFLFDIKIISRTFFLIIKPDGAY